MLASTPDANTTDPYVQEKAAELGYDPLRIIDYLHTQIGYNSYTGSLRGARGTLWSNAGNSLDEASLGVALLRASGIPARYAEGTLPDNLAQQLILSMFPNSFQTVGYIPAGTQVSDPAHDLTLLAETRDHYWIEYDTGNGFQDADPEFAGAPIDQPVTMVQNTFAEVPDNLRHKVEVKLNAELSGNYVFGVMETKTVLDETFNTVELVGRPLSIGHFVNTTALSGLFFAVTRNTYSPYIDVGDEAYPDGSHDEVIRGTDYQEYLTNFAGASQFLTGLFLEMDVSSPGGPTQTYEKTLLDRIGFAARQNGGAQTIAINSSGQPSLSELDQVTINVLPGLQSPSAIASQRDSLSRLQNELNALLPTLSSIPTSGPQTAEQRAALGNAALLEREITTTTNETLGTLFALASDQALSQLESGYSTKGYYISPRLLVSSTHQEGNQVNVSLDLVKNDARDVPAPGQVVSTALFFEMMRGLFESNLEGQIVAEATGRSPISIAEIFDQLQGSGGLVMISQDNLQQLDSLALSDTAKARITKAVMAGETVMTPTQMVQINGQTTVGWLETDWSTGHTISVMEDGEHQALVEYPSIISNPLNTGAAAYIGTMQGFSLSQIAFLGKLLEDVSGGTPFKEAVQDAKSEIVREAFDIYKKLFNKYIATPIEEEIFQSMLKDLGQAIAPFAELVQLDNVINTLTSDDFVKIGKLILTQFNTFLSKPLPEDAALLFVAHAEGLIAGMGLGLAWIYRNFPDDPSVFPFLSTDLSILSKPNEATTERQLPSNLVPAPLSASVTIPSLSLTNQVDASWSSVTMSSFLATSLNANSAIVKDANGNSIGSGTVVFSAAAATPLFISGSDQYSVSGTGSLSFYAPAETSLGVSGDWDSYSATATGNVSITIITGGLTLNGNPLPPGTYTLTTSSATLVGSGLSTSPNFSGSASINATGSTVDLGPGTGNIAVGGKPLDPTDGVTLTDYTGTINVSANGDGTDAVTLNGDATNVLQVSRNAATLSTNQNTPITFPTNVQTSFADTYTLTAQAPQGWTVTIDNNGNVAATPAPGLQGGTFTIQIIAQSTTNPDLVAQSAVNVTITPTPQPGITLAVQPDTLFTVPFQDAQLPTAFRAVIHNNGPTADTYNLSFSNVPSGFTLLNSGTTVTIPAGETGEVGIYLQPNPGQPVPTPGTQVSFTVTATSTTSPSITQTQIEAFTVPAIDAVNVSNNPSSVNTTPGTPVADTITLTNVGNVPENIALAATTPTGLTASGLGTVSLGVGRSATETITLTPDASTTLNSTITATVTATFGPAGSPQTQAVQIPVQVVVPGAQAIADGAVAAGQIGSTDLAARFNDLSLALTNLVQNPSDVVAKSQTLANLDSLIGQLSADPFLSDYAGDLTTARGAIAAASTPQDIQTAVTNLGNALASLSTAISDEAAHNFTLSFFPNSQVGLPQRPVQYVVVLQNTGSQTTTYDLSVSGLPSGVTASFSPSSITLAPGQITPAALAPGRSRRRTVCRKSPSRLPRPQRRSFPLSASQSR